MRIILTSPHGIDTLISGIDATHDELLHMVSETLALPPNVGAAFAVDFPTRTLVIPALRLAGSFISIEEDGLAENGEARILTDESEDR